MEPEDASFWRVVRSLPAQQAQAVTLFYLEDRPVAEIAEILDCAPSTARVHLFKGRKALADRLGLEDGR
jgi:RNA polymerase sigma-70 factor (ECF subfamily)